MQLAARPNWGPEDPPTPVEAERSRGARRNAVLLALSLFSLLALRVLKTVRR